MRKQSNSSGAETTFWGSRDDPGAVKGRKTEEEKMWRAFAKSPLSLR